MQERTKQPSSLQMKGDIRRKEGEKGEGGKGKGGREGGGRGHTEIQLGIEIDIYTLLLPSFASCTSQANGFSN